MLIQMFPMQLLNMFYLLKDLKNCFFQWSHEIFKQGYESINSVFIAVVTYIICCIITCIIFKFLLLFVLLLDILSIFRYMVIISFSFTVYDIIYIKNVNRTLSLVRNYLIFPSNVMNKHNAVLIYNSYKVQWNIKHQKMI